MTDVALDDLIKQDKQKHKGKPRINRDRIKGGRGGPRRGGDRRGGHIRKNSDSRNDRDNNKTRIIRKGDRHDRDRNNRNDRGRGDRFRGNDRRNRDFNDRRRDNRPERTQNQSSDQVQQKGRTLKVMGLHPDFTNQDLYKLFATEGALQKCLIQQDNFGRSMTTAIVKYHNAQSAKSAIQNLNQHKLNHIKTKDHESSINFKKRQ